MLAPSELKSRLHMPHKNLNLHAPIGDEVKTTTCYMCACRCGIKVHLRDKQVRYIQGNADHPVNKGVLCAKGSAGMMQHVSPARLKSPMLRTGPRGSGQFKNISWDEALEIATAWIKPLRESDPNQLAFFTGRDQSQALTGWWAQQFGTINYAAHGGFCSVNMAAAGMYSMGSAFWEFGEPDWEHSKYFVMWGVAEDHDSNPIKLGMAKLKANGAKIVVVNPVRTGYGAIADEWIGIRPGSDGLLIGALIQELLNADRIDFDYLVRYTNAHWLVIQDSGAADDGMFARGENGAALCATDAGLVDATSSGIKAKIAGEFTLADGRKAVPAFQLLAQRYLGDEYQAENVAERCGIDAATIKRLAAEMAQAAFDQAITLDQPWTDVHGVEHASMQGRPVSMHAMRGISAHSNGFQTCRALHILQMLLGAIETPGSFRFQPPYPKGIPPANRPGKTRREDGTLDGAPLGYPQAPQDLLVDEHGQPRRLDKAFSWQYPLAVHGMMHSVIRNAWAGDPQRINTLMMFMANMAWNSAMNTQETLHWLTDKDDSGEYKIPHIIYSDAYASEMVAYADLIFPDTTYLERHDAISFLDRPISDADAAIDGIRQPVVEPDRDVRAFQSVLIDLGARVGLPGLLNANGSAKYPGGYPDYIANHERAPGVGLLAGWRGASGNQDTVGAANASQLEQYQANGCFYRSEVPERGRYFKMANRDYLEWARSLGFVAKTDAQTLLLYSETLQKFRLAALGHGEHQPPEADRERVAKYFDPLPFWYEPFESAAIDRAQFPLAAITQRPMFMYHAWGSQNAWLRQILNRNRLYLHPSTAENLQLQEGDWAFVFSHHGKIRVQIGISHAVEAGTVWTWNALGKRKGTWGLKTDAPEATDGFLLNHLISDVLPADQKHLVNADPITGQAAWFDLCVRVEKCATQQPGSEPQLAQIDLNAYASGAATRLRTGAKSGT